MYVSGGPGTGKTSCAKAVVTSCLTRHQNVVSFEVNCMRDLRQQSLVGLVARLVEMSGGGASVRSRMDEDVALAALVQQFAVAGKSVVIVVDEADQLLTRGSASERGASNALDCLFRLPFCSGAPRMAIIAIANAVDLLDRPRSCVQKGLAQSLLFEPYSAAELREIFRATLAASEHGNAAQGLLGLKGVEMCVRQVAKQSGDCRRLLSGCNQALFTAAAAANDSVEESETASARPQVGVQKVESDPLVSLSQLPMDQQVLLCGLATARSETLKLSEVCSRHKELCKRLHQPVNLASRSHIGAALSVLEQRGLLSLRTVRSGRAAGEQLAELAVSCKLLRAKLAALNPLLEQCIND